MTRKIKKGQRIGRNPKTGTEVPRSPRRVIVFTPSDILKQRINGHSRGGLSVLIESEPGSNLLF